MTNTVGQNQSGARKVSRSFHSRHLGLILLIIGMGAPVLLAAPGTTSTTLTVTAAGLSVSSVDAGTVVTLTATVETGGKAVALGQVNFCDATAKLCSDINLLGRVPLTTTGTAVLSFVPRAGSHSYKAEFVSTINENASASTAQPLLVYGATTTTIGQSGSSGDYTLKATVTGVTVDSAPAGNVEFRDTSDGNVVLATAALGAGTSSSAWVNTQSPATKPQPLSIVVGDFNGDGIPDIGIGTNGIPVGTNGTITGYLSILLGKGNGTFEVANSFTSLPNNQAMVADHFVNGGSLDILTVDSNASGTNNAALFIGNGDGGGTLQTPFSLGGIANVTAVAAGDFNRDGNEDFVMTGVIYGVYCFAPVLGNGKGTFGGPTLNAVGNNPLAVAVGSFNTNGYPDIVVADSGADQVTIFENNSQGYFFPEGQANTGTNPVAMVTGDFNGDGFLDLAIVNNGSDNVTVLLGHGNETLTAGSTFSTGHAPTSIAVGDFNGDGIADLAVVNSGDRTISILQGKGDGTFDAQSTIATGINPVNVVTGDFSGTGLADVAVTNQYISSTTGSTLTIQAAESTQTASATVTKVAPAGSGSHQVDADYPGDSMWNASISKTTSLTATTLPTVVTPAINPPGGTYASTQEVTIQDGIAGTVIYYTTNGTTPTTSSTKYTGAIPVSNSETIRAIAVKTGYNDSDVASAEYVIEASAPIFSLAAGTYASAQSVKITSATTGATIYYTTNGTAPTTASTKYTTGIAISASETIKAIAVALGFATSPVATAAYVIETPTASPVFSPVAGTYSATQSVKITSTVANAAIFYTTNGATPTTSSSRYLAAITVSASETIKAIAVATGHSNSAVASSAYIIETPTAPPTFSVTAGTYSKPESVTLNDTTIGAAIYYTTNGATPTTSSSKYSAAITVQTSETIKAIAVAIGHANSVIASAEYTIVSPAAKPTFSVPSGTYSSAQSVQIFDTTPGATVYYTTNGAAPTPASTVYKSAVSVSETEYLQAIAVADGYTTSPLATSIYSIGADVTASPVLSPPPGAYGKPQSVTIKDATPGAVITYSVGIGSVVNTYTYTGPFTVSSTEYIAYDAIAPGYTHSADLEGIYTIGTAPTPQFSPAAGSYSTAQAVNIYDITPGAIIYYTTDGTTPTTASAVYTDPVVVAANQTIHAFAAISGLTRSAAISAAYIIGNGVATPTFSLAAGSYSSTKSVTITDITPGATVYYTINGTTPTASSTKYIGPISVATTETLKAIAVATGYTNSAVATVAYTIGYPIETVTVTSSGTNVLTIPVGGSGAFAVATKNQSGQNYPSISVKTSTGANPLLPVQITLCQTNPSTGQCMSTPGATLTLAPFAAGATPSFSVFVTATAAITSNPSNEILVQFTNPSGTVLGSASVLVVTN